MARFDKKIFLDGSGVGDFVKTLFSYAFMAI